jgi:hypothetical protein
MQKSRKHSKRSKSRKKKSAKSKTASYLPSNMLGGFIRGGVAQHSYYCGVNPLTANAPYNVLNQCQTGSCNNTAPDQYIQNGGRTSKHNKMTSLYYKYI